MVARPAIRQSLYALVALTVAHALACRTPPEWQALDQRIDSFTRLERATRHLPERARTAVVSMSYRGLFATIRQGVTLDDLDHHGIDVLYRAARLAAFHTYDDEHVRDMASALGALQERGRATRHHHLRMYEMFVGARMLSEARALATQRPSPDMEVLPALLADDLIAGHPTEWVVDPDEYLLQRRSVDVSEASHVVVVTHPRCHFSLAAMQHIEADAVLRGVLAKHATRLAPQDTRLDVEVIQQWNRDHPEQEISLVFRRDEWPMVDSWATPTFYVLENGAVRAKLEGWPSGGRRSELLAALRHAGLL